LVRRLKTVHRLRLCAWSKALKARCRRLALAGNRQQGIGSNDQRAWEDESPYGCAQGARPWRETLDVVVG